jgi:hypothetical protein
MTTATAITMYAIEISDPNPLRPGGVAMGTLIDPVPVTGFAMNFSPNPRMAPPPLGSAGLGAFTACGVVPVLDFASGAGAFAAA